VIQHKGGIYESRLGYDLYHSEQEDAGFRVFYREVSQGSLGAEWAEFMSLQAMSLRTQPANSRKMN
jgi:hypothetical protein